MSQPPDIDVLVIGGGAAGLMCAGTAAARGKTVLLLERMPQPGRKLLITGKGRCNLTNNCEFDAFIACVNRGGRFLYSAWNGFSARDTMAFFEQLGVPLKTERGNRVFPVSDRSADVVDALVRYARSGGVTITQERAVKLLVEDNRAAGVIGESGREYRASSVVIATGGVSYPLTGSTGDGYQLAAQAGHTVISPQPSLVPIEVQESLPREAMGLSLKNVTLTLTKAGSSKVLFQELGEMLFTHFGVSGPLVLSASAHMDNHPGTYALHIDLKPALTHQKLDQRILRDFSEAMNRDFSNALSGLLPKKLIDPVIALSGISPQTKVHQITREQRGKLVQLLKDLCLHVRALRPIEEAVVTRGGVELKQVNPSTMESKILPGLYFAGEVLDLDAYTGGFNLQIAFSTGYLAGKKV
jgi:predicted Rossmann fold flavoprotein